MCYVPNVFTLVALVVNMEDHSRSPVSTTLTFKVISLQDFLAQVEPSLVKILGLPCIQVPESSAPWLPLPSPHLPPPVRILQLTGKHC